MFKYGNVIAHINTCIMLNKFLSSEFLSSDNGIKQGAVISPLLFSIYIDNIFKELKQLGIGCYVGRTFAGLFGYADDVALIAPSLYTLEKMFSVCESYEIIYIRKLYI